MTRAGRDVNNIATGLLDHKWNHRSTAQKGPLHIDGPGFLNLSQLQVMD